MPHSLWNGAISFGLVNIPVVLYSAENRNSFDLTMLDRRNMKPVGVKRYKSDCSVLRNLSIIPGIMSGRLAAF